MLLLIHTTSLCEFHKILTYMQKKICTSVNFSVVYRMRLFFFETFITFNYFTECLKLTLNSILFLRKQRNFSSKKGWP